MACFWCVLNGYIIIVQQFAMSFHWGILLSCSYPQELRSSVSDCVWHGSRRLASQFLTRNKAADCCVEAYLMAPKMKKSMTLPQFSRKKTFFHLKCKKKTRNNLFTFSQTKNLSPYPQPTRKLRRPAFRKASA